MTTQTKPGPIQWIRCQFRLSTKTLDGIDQLSRAWGPVRPLSMTDVVREAVRRAVEAERHARMEEVDPRPCDKIDEQNARIEKMLKKARDRKVD